MLNILDAAGDLIATATTKGETVTVDRGEWDLFVAAWNQQHDLMDEMCERQEARQGDDFVRLHEARMAAA